VSAANNNNNNNNNNINLLTSSIENEEVEELKKIPMLGHFYWDLEKIISRLKKIPGVVM